MHDCKKHFKREKFPDLQYYHCCTYVSIVRCISNFSIFQAFEDSTSPDNSASNEQSRTSGASAQSEQHEMQRDSTAQLEKKEELPLLQLEEPGPAPREECFVQHYSTMSKEDSKRCITTSAELREIFGEEAYKKTPGGEEGIICYCGETECLIEFNLYKYREPTSVG